MQPIIDWLNEQNKTVNKGNIFPPCMNAQLAIVYLKEYLLGEDWHSCNPISTEQINTEIVFAILQKYSRKFRKEIRKRKNANK